MQFRISVCWLLLLTPLSFAQRDAQVPDPDPEIERRTFVLPEGFEVNLFAADPMLAKPIQMNFDPDGRLWVASSEVYPQILPGQTANDRVLILEDTNNDGRADKTTVFADGLLIPTGLVPGDGGVYVADSTDLVHFSDPDPATGKARKKRIVLSGFGTEDTHHIIHTFRWGPWGDLHFSQSIYIHSHVETPYGPRRLNAGGVWAYRPRTQELSVLARGLVNSWGTAFDRFGRSFWTDGAGGDGINILVPGMYGFTAADAPRILPGLNPGSPKHCGLAVASGRHLPDDWQGSLLTNDFRGHRVCRFVLKDDGSGYQSIEQKELIKSDHPAFRPVDVIMGPDGAIYIADWYNPIIQHGEVDFRDPRRDKTHGRIWRVTVKDRPLLEKPKLSQASLIELFDALRNPEDYTRQMAKQVLRERPADEVATEARRRLTAADATEQEQLELAYVLRSVDRLEEPELKLMLQAKDYRVRGMACRLAGTHPAGATLLLSMPQDPHPQVRLEAIRALVHFPSYASAQAVVRSLQLPSDRWLEYSTWLALRELAPAWLETVQTGSALFTNNPDHLVYALQAAGTNEAGRPLLALARDPANRLEQRDTAWLALAKLGNANECALVLEAILEDANRPTAEAILSELARSIAARKVNLGSESTWARLVELANDSRDGTRHAAYRLLGLTKRAEFGPILLAKLDSQTTPERDYEPLTEALLTLRGPQSKVAFNVEAIRRDANQAPRRSLARLRGLLEVDTPAAATVALELLHNEQFAEHTKEIVQQFISRKGGTAELAKALSGKSLPADQAKIALAVVKSSAQPDATLMERIAQAADLKNQGWQLQGDEAKAFLRDVSTKGDPARGEIVYRRAELNCRKCHAIAGAGGLVGPDLSSIGASAPVDYLLESLIYPDAKIKEGYNSYLVTTIDGKVYSGIRVRESSTELVLRDSEGKQITIPKEDIEAKSDGNSLMPAGLVDILTRQELLDLTRFLSVLGKGDYAATPGNRVRRYEALQPTKPMYTLLNRVRLGAVATDTQELTWLPAYSNVSGELPLDEFPEFKRNADAPLMSVVRFVIDTTSAGPAMLRLNQSTGLMIWSNGEPIDATDRLSLKLATGPTIITIVIDRTKRSDGLIVDLELPADAPTRAAVRNSE